METIIEARGLGKRYLHKDAVHDLNLALPAGRACAFLGRNGAGKTTTIKMLAGLIRPNNGSCSLFGRDSQHLRPEDWQKTGYVSENQELYDWMTGEQLVAFTSKLYPSWDKPFEKELLEKLGIPLKRRMSWSIGAGLLALAAIAVVSMRWDVNLAQRLEFSEAAANSNDLRIAWLGEPYISGGSQNNIPFTKVIREARVDGVSDGWMANFSGVRSPRSPANA